ncbi:hypothetical protein HCH52_12105 [Oscillospiraceae bacterium HV4-5-C5C]|nr:hypothetical protein [Oscillospiraceae bacterium HV4-5-C5C]
MLESELISVRKPLQDLLYLVLEPELQIKLRGREEPRPETRTAKDDPAQKPTQNQAGRTGQATQQQALQPAEINRLLALIDQETNGAFRAAVVKRDVNAVVMIVQQAGRALKLARTLQFALLDTIIPKIRAVQLISQQ